MQMVVASKGELTESVASSGDIRADEAALLSFHTAGELQEINVNTGDSVKKGQIIASLDTTAFYSNLQEANAALRASQANLNNVYDTLQGHSANENYSQIAARTAAETAKDSAYWNYVAAKNAYEGAIIKAPFDGIVTQVPTGILPGSFIGVPSQSSFAVVNPDTIYFSADIDELDIPKVKVGQDVQVQLDAYPDESFKGKVDKIEYASSLGSTGGTVYKIKITMPKNDGLKFRLGMNGSAEIVLAKREDVLMVPVSAVVETGGKNYVWINDKGRARRKEVQIGSSSVNDTEITSGLDVGEKVISQPPAEIKNEVRLKSK